MPLQRHKFKPADTDWITVEIVVAYSCESPPKVESTKISGLKQFGFILSSEYDIEVMVDDYWRHSCDRAGCQTAFQYDFDVKLFVADIVGLGLNLGSWGTGTAGWRFPTTEEQHSLSTACICCDDKLEEKRMLAEAAASVRRRPDASALIIGFSAIAAAGVLSVVYVDHPNHLGISFLWICSFALLTSLLVIMRRLAARMRRRKTELLRAKSHGAKLDDERYHNDSD
jgi:hypothetical protein